MTIRRACTALASAVLVGSAVTVAPPAAQAATTSVAVDCNNTTFESFTVAPGDQIVFTLNSACQTMISSGMTLYSLTFQGIVNRMAILTGTNGSAVADQAAWTVTYTAGPDSGTDSLNVSNVGMAPRALRPRIGANDYSMTVPGAGGPPPWLQAYGRAAGATCVAGWNPSWAQWPNGNTGGFVCVRTVTYNNATGAWDTRRARR